MRTTPVTLFTAMAVGVVAITLTILFDRGGATPERPANHRAYPPTREGSAVTEIRSVSQHGGSRRSTAPDSSTSPEPELPVVVGGRVVDARQGKGIAGATIMLLSSVDQAETSDATRRIATVESDGDGRFTFSVDAESIRQANFILAVTESGASGRVSAPSKSTDELLIKVGDVQRAASLEFFVSGADTVAVGASRAWLECDPLTATRSGIRTPIPTSNGWLLEAEVEACMLEGARIVLSIPGRGTFRSSRFTIAPSDASVQGPIRIDVPSVATISGSVIDSETSAPVPGVRISVEGRQPSTGVTTVTDPNGSFELPVVSAADEAGWLLVDSPFHPRTRHELAIVESDADLEFVLGNGIELAGAVVDRGRRIGSDLNWSDLVIQIEESLSTSGTRRGRAEVDAFGRFQVAGLTGGGVSLTVADAFSLDAMGPNLHIPSPGQVSGLIDIELAGAEQLVECRLTASGDKGSEHLANRIVRHRVAGTVQRAIGYEMDLGHLDWSPWRECVIGRATTIHLASSTLEQQNLALELDLGDSNVLRRLLRMPNGHDSLSVELEVSALVEAMPEPPVGLNGDRDTSLSEYWQRLRERRITVDGSD